MAGRGPAPYFLNELGARAARLTGPRAPSSHPLPVGSTPTSQEKNSTAATTPLSSCFLPHLSGPRVRGGSRGQHPAVQPGSRDHPPPMPAATGTEAEPGASCRRLCYVPLRLKHCPLTFGGWGLGVHTFQRLTSQAAGREARWALSKELWRETWRWSPSGPLRTSPQPSPSGHRFTYLKLDFLLC